MKYFRCDWFHSVADDPLVIYAEIDDKRWGFRKVDIYADGRRGFASQAKMSRDPQLSTEPWPPFEQINSDQEFKLVDEFEEIWAQ